MNECFEGGVPDGKCGGDNVAMSSDESLRAASHTMLLLYSSQCQHLSQIISDLSTTSRHNNAFLSLLSSKCFARIVQVCHSVVYMIVIMQICCIDNPYQRNQFSISSISHCQELCWSGAVNAVSCCCCWLMLGCCSLQ